MRFISNRTRQRREPILQNDSEQQEPNEQARAEAHEHTEATAEPTGKRSEQPETTTQPAAKSKRAKPQKKKVSRGTQVTISLSRTVLVWLLFQRGRVTAWGTISLVPDPADEEAETPLGRTELLQRFIEDLGIQGTTVVSGSVFVCSTHPAFARAGRAKEVLRTHDPG